MRLSCLWNRLLINNKILHTNTIQFWFFHVLYSFSRQLLNYHWRKLDSNLPRTRDRTWRNGRVRPWWRCLMFHVHSCFNVLRQITLCPQRKHYAADSQSKLHARMNCKYSHLTPDKVINIRPTIKNLSWKSFYLNQKVSAHLTLVFGARGALASAGGLPGWNHSNLLYWHAAVSRQHSVSLPLHWDALSSSGACDPLSHPWAPHSCFTLLPRPDLNHPGERQRWNLDQVTVATGRQLGRWWGVR